MDMSYNELGKLVVRFNGVVLTNCVHDTDCPPTNSECFTNETWAAYPSMCACPSALTGANCTDRSGPNIVRVAIDSVSLALIVPLLIIGFIDIARIIRKRLNAGRFTWLNVVEATSVFATLAVCFIPLVLADFIYTVPQPRTETKVKDGQITRVASYSSMNVGYVLGFFFLSLSMLNTTLLWLSIAYDAKRVRVNTNNLILRYKYVLVLYYLIFGVAILVFAIIDRNEYAYFVGIPAIIIVICTCFFAWYKLKFELERFGSESHNILRKVERTAAFLGLSCLLALIFAIVSYLPDRPDYTFGEPCRALFWFCIVFTQAAVISFTHPAITNRARKDQESRGGSKPSSRDTATGNNGPEGTSRTNGKLTTSAMTTHVAVEPIPQ